jgi:hypothetical protein
MVEIARDEPELRRLIAETLRNNVAAKDRQTDALDELKRRWAAYVKKMRVLCLSELADNTAMWHHYAEAYRGGGPRI